MKEIFGILAAILGVSAGVPYVYSIFRGSTKPHRISWAIWATLGAITFASYVSSGARWSALLAFAAAFNNVVIFLLSLKFGAGGSSARDRICLAIGLLGAAFWAITRRAEFALAFAITADAIGTAVTLEKAYRNPHSESALAWSMACLASLCGLLAVHTYTLAQTIYPAYAFIGGLALAAMTIIRGKVPSSSD